MRICVLTTSFPLYRGSLAGSSVFYECQHLVKQGVDVRVLAPHHTGSKTVEKLEGIDVRRFRYMFPSKLQRFCYGEGIQSNLSKSLFARIQIFPFFIFFLFNTVVYARKADIIHCHWSPAGIVGVIVGKLIYRKPVVLMIRHGHNKFGHGLKLIFRWLLKNIDYLLANNSFTMHKILGVRKIKNRMVIPSGRDIKKFHPQNRRKDFYEKIGFDHDKPLLFALGRLVELKGFGYLIGAIELLVRKNGMDQVQLMIGGDGPLRADLEAMVARKGLKDHIRFLGYLPHEETPTYFAQADVFILPSIIDDQGQTEGLGSSLIEANACGVPCIGTRVGGIVDVITDGENGFLVEEKSPEKIAEKVKFLIDNPRRREEMGEAGRRIVKEKFDSDILARCLINLYEEILNRKT